MIDIDAMKSDAAILLDESAEEVSYTISGATPEIVTVVAAIGLRHDQFDDGRIQATQTMTVLAASLVPKPGDTVVIRGRNCRINAVRDDGYGLIECDLATGDEV